MNISTGGILKVLVAVGLALILAACSDSGPGSDTGSTLRAVVGDPTTGMSSEAVKAQLNVQIGSSYQLILAVEPYVQLVLDDLSDPYGNTPVDNIGNTGGLPGQLPGTDSAVAKLGEAVLVGLMALMPQATGEVREELKVFLVDYFLDNS